MPRGRFFVLCPPLQRLSIRERFRLAGTSGCHLILTFLFKVRLTSKVGQVAYACCKFLYLLLVPYFIKLITCASFSSWPSLLHRKQDWNVGDRRGIKASVSQRRNSCSILDKCYILGKCDAIAFTLLKLENNIGAFQFMGFSVNSSASHVFGNASKKPKYHKCLREFFWKVHIKPWRFSRDCLISVSSNSLKELSVTNTALSADAFSLLLPQIV